MVCGVVVARGVVVLRAVAAAQVAARDAQPKMNPLVARGQALFAPFRSIGLGCLQLVEMRAGGLCHESQPTASACAEVSFRKRGVSSARGFKESAQHPENLGVLHASSSEA